MGVYLDRIGPRWTMTVLSLAAVFGVLVFAGSNSLTMAVIGRRLLGVGMACNLMGSFKLLTLWFDPLRFATLSAMVVSIGTLGNIVSTTPLVLLLRDMGLRNVFVLFAAITFFVAIIFYSIVRDKPHETPLGPPQRTSVKGLKEILSDLFMLFRAKD